MADDEQPDLSAFGDRADDDGDTPDGEVADDGDPSAGGDPGDDSRTDADADAGDPVDADPDGTAPDESRPSLADLDRNERVDLGVALLAHLERASLPLPEAVDRIETVTTSPALTREILDAADRRGIIDRDGGRIRIRRGGTFVRFDRQVVRRRGDYTCRRCGASLETGHFVRLDPGELGPFGPDCVRRVLGRS